MLSKSKLKLIKSLKNKKSRESLNLFVVEGLKGIMEVNNSSYDVDSSVYYALWDDYLFRNNFFDEI